MSSNQFMCYISTMYFSSTIRNHFLNMLLLLLIVVIPTTQLNLSDTDYFTRSPATSDIIMQSMWVLKCGAVCSRDVICVAYDVAPPVPPSMSSWSCEKVYSYSTPLASTSVRYSRLPIIQMTTSPSTELPPTTTILSTAMPSTEIPSIATSSMLPDTTEQPTTQPETSKQSTTVQISLVQPIVSVFHLILTTLVSKGEAFSYYVTLKKNI